VELALAGRVALVTGSGKGIGAAVARRLAALGATTVVSGRTRSDLERTASDITQEGGKAVIQECDVSNLKSVEALAQKVGSEVGGLHILVNNAGIGGFKNPLVQMSPDAWDQILNTNLRGVFYCIRSLAPLMIRSGGGHIINISSLAGKNPLPNGAAYAASKWALSGCRRAVDQRKATSVAAFSRAVSGPRGVEEPVHARDLFMLRTGRSHDHPPVVMEGRVVRGRPRP